MVSRSLFYTFITSTFFGFQFVTALPLDINLDIDVGIGLDIDIDLTTLGRPDYAASYDYVIIGGGTAGLTIASRLSESYNVAVIEAGTYYETVNNQSTVPEYVTDFLSTSMEKTTWAATDWGFTTTNQTAVGGAQYHYSRAKTLGGCSAFNAMVYHRGSTGSYDLWAEQVEDDDYKWENFLPYFVKGVNLTIAERPPNATIPTQNASAYIVGNGPLNVEYPAYATPFSAWAKLGMVAAGFPEVSDFLSGTLLGTQYAPMTGNQATGTRESSQTSYLDAAIAAKQSITIYNGTMGQKINFNSAKKAISVEVSTKGGASYTISAKQEIILSAGVFQSPQLLMVSGIGPQATLKKFDIPVISSLAGVGQNMWDHVFFSMLWPTDMETRQRLLNTKYLDTQITDYLETHKTIMSSNGLDYFGWEKYPNRTQFCSETLADLAAFPADWPELELISGSVANAALPNEYRDYTAMLSAIVSPTSRGSVTISSKDINDQPVINPNWLSTRTDQDQAIAAFKRVRQIMETDAVARGLIGPEVVPGATIQTDAEILAYIKSSFSTVWHAACTCKMGKEADSMAVIDTHARVYGVAGLRVVDASSLPLLPPGHPQSTIYALAEKIAEDIKTNDCDLPYLKQ